MKDGRGCLGCMKQRTSVADGTCTPKAMNAEDPPVYSLHLGSTGMPKGVVHTTGRLHRYAFNDHQYVFAFYQDARFTGATAGVGLGHRPLLYRSMGSACPIGANKR